MHRHAYTLPELLVAMAVGLMVSSLAFVVFANTGRYLSRIEVVGVKTEAVQAMVQWSMAQKDWSGFPTGVISRRVQVRAIDDTASGSTAVAVRLLVPPAVTPFTMADEMRYSVNLIAGRP